MHYCPKLGGLGNLLNVRVGKGSKRNERNVPDEGNRQTDERQTPSPDENTGKGMGLERGMMIWF